MKKRTLSFLVAALVSYATLTAGVLSFPQTSHAQSYYDMCATSCKGIQSCLDTCNACVDACELTSESNVDGESICGETCEAQAGEDACQGNVTCETGQDFETFGESLAADPLGTLFGGSDDDVTSFTEFTGGLEAPSTEGYSAGLVQQTNARDFILQVTNFALGFLGLIAVIIIIYGGFLYVTAAGNEENSTKGKKSITYALIGIIIILSSFAIVNTILRAPQGTDQGAQNLKGSAQEQFNNLSPDEQTKVRRQLFNTASSSVVTVARDLYTAYQNFSQTRADVESLKKVPDIGTSADFSTLMASKQSMIQSIAQKANPIGSVQEKASTGIGIINTNLQESSAALSKSGGDEKKWAQSFWTSKKSTLTTSFNTLSSDVKKANESDFGLAVTDAWNKIKELRADIGTAASLPDVTAAFDKVKADLNALLQSGQLTQLPFYARTVIHVAYAQVAKSTVTNAEVYKALQSLSELYNKVKDIIFIYAAIQADITGGSAPLIVNFDALRSIDPNNRTLTDFKWDFGDTSTQKTAEGPTVTHTFEKPGTYVVKLTIKSPPALQGEEQVADGFASIRIAVRPPINKIYLKAIIGQDTFDLRKYDSESGSLLIDQGVLKVSPSEATAGIEFDATETAKDKLQSIKWNFGDSSPEVVQSGEGIQLTQSHQYAQAGTYQMYLEVTDTQNNVDRKVVNVIVGSPIARITVVPGTMGKVNETFIFDGGSSTSDGGQIAKYEWNALSPDATKVESGTDAETFKASFTKPGTNKIQLTVTDNLGETDDESIDVTAESAAPEAQYTYDIPDPTQPGLVHFNGGLSYDPDGTDQTLLDYSWQVNGQTAGDGFSFANGTTATSEKPQIKFTTIGSYAVTLVATDPNGFGQGAEQPSSVFEKEIIIDKVLDVAWGSGDKNASILSADQSGTGEAKAPINFTLVSDQGIAYEIDYGDGEKENGEMTGTANIVHDYKEAGNFAVKATVFDEEDADNSIARKVFIGSNNTPVSVAGMLVNDQEVFDTTQTIKVARTDVVTFDGGNSLNTDGTGRRLNYSWDFGDGQRSTQSKINHTYKELGTYEASLKVTNASDVSQSSPVDKISIEVIGQPPSLRSITAIPTSTSLTTPVTVTLNAIGAEDLDGKITRYRWWYFDPNNDTDELGVQVTDGPTATVTIGTRGEEGQQKTYRFAVAITDDENNTVSSRDLLDDSRTATLDVENGPNKAPVASFNVDRTSIFVGDVVNFSSSSTDADGQIVSYYWDFEGDGFANNTENGGSNFAHTFDKPAKDGIRVRLKVKDNNESEAVSDPVTIYVDSVAKPPSASFNSTQQGTGKQVKFTDTSTADEASGANLVKWEWDFNINFDSNGDGVKDNDLESNEQNPTHEYSDYGIFRAKLSVTDSEGNNAKIANFVNVKAPTASASTPTSGAATSPEKTTKPGTEGGLGADIFAADTNNIAALLVSIAGFAILFLSLKRLNKEK